MTEPSVVREEKRQVTLSNHCGEARFLNGELWVLDLGPTRGNRATIPLPSETDKTIDRLTEYIEFLRFVRAEVRRIRDGAQEHEDNE